MTPFCCFVLGARASRSIKYARGRKRKYKLNLEKFIIQLTFAIQAGALARLKDEWGKFAILISANFVLIPRKFLVCNIHTSIYYLYLHTVCTQACAKCRSQQIRVDLSMSTQTPGMLNARTLS